MILKGSQRGGAQALAKHLLNDFENDHVELLEVRGFVSSDLHGALAEAEAVSKGTRCKQFMFSLSLSPPKDGQASLELLIDAADRAEASLGLKNQSRALVVHEKNGRRHMHVVWSRIDVDEMKAINLPHFKNRLRDLSKELYLENAWELPAGHRENGWKNPLNFTLAEWQQCKRIDLDPKEVKQVFQESWARSDGFASFRAALEERGYFLAAGDRRGFVALDVQGEVFSVSRFASVKTKDLEAKLGSPDRLPGVAAVHAEIKKHIDEKKHEGLKQALKARAEKLAPLNAERNRMVAVQRAERERLRTAQERRRIEENRIRQDRLRRGIGGVWDILTGRAASIRRQNDQEAFTGYRRDREQQERLFEAQQRDRRELQRRLERETTEQRDRLRLLARNVARLWTKEQPAQSRGLTPRRRGHELEFDR